MTKALRAAVFLVLVAAPARAQWQTIEPGGSTAFYTTAVGGVRLVDWVSGLLSTRPPASVP